MPVRDLHGILTASRKAGLRRFLYHPEPDFGAPEWGLISSLCGRQWDEEAKGGYWPSATLRPEVWNGGRIPPDED